MGHDVIQDEPMWSSVMSSIACCCKHLSYNKDRIACCCAFWRNKNVITKRNCSAKWERNKEKARTEKNALVRSCWPPISNLSLVWLGIFSWWCLKMLSTEKLQYLH